LGDESPLHFRSQVEPELQLSEQLEVQVTWQVDFSQEMLPLLPTVAEQVLLSQLRLALSVASRVQVLSLWHSLLHDLPHCAVQVFPSMHLSEQLSPVHPVLSRVQLAPALQVHALPLHGQADPGHAETAVAELHPLKLSIERARSRQDARIGIPPGDG
jgi:hypothetical protein